MSNSTVPIKEFRLWLKRKFRPLRIRLSAPIHV